MTHILVDVLTQDDAGLYAVYRVITPARDTYSDAELEHMAHLGQKLNFREARCSFPALPEDKYRD